MVASRGLHRQMFLEKAVILKPQGRLSMLSAALQFSLSPL
jgi:hypothetical protein